MKAKSKIAVVLILLVALGFSVFAEDSPKTFFPSLASSPKYPSDKDLGIIASASQTEGHKLLSAALKEEYSFEWVEKYVAEESRKMITTLNSELLSSLLPAGSVLFSAAHSNPDNSVSIVVKRLDTNEIISFVIKNNKIISINKSKK